MSVTGTSRPPQWPLQGWSRLGIAALGVGLLAPLIVAAILTPNPEGRGTHQQLGLPPCSMVVLFGRPCPTCGMTTAWANVVRGKWRDALQANLGGTLLCLLDIAALPWVFLSAARGRWIGGRYPSLAITVAAVVIAVITLIEWIGRFWTA